MQVRSVAAKRCAEQGIDTTESMNSKVMHTGHLYVCEIVCFLRIAATVFVLNHGHGVSRINTKGPQLQWRVSGSLYKCLYWGGFTLSLKYWADAMLPGCENTKR